MYQDWVNKESIRSIGGEFELVSETELDEEFDVVDGESPSAANGATKSGADAAANGFDSIVRASGDADD